jgi:uncharacterized protein YndB with AHSA1/START domain
MCPANDAAAEADDQMLVITRLFDAPRALVFKAWTDQALVLKWLGPRNYPAIQVEQDLRPGGAWRACLRAVDGSRVLWQGGVYREIVAPERLVYSFAWDDDSGRPGPETLITVTFAEQGGKTRMVFTQTPFATADRRDGHRTGWHSAFDRLAEYLATGDRS